MLNPKLISTLRPHFWEKLYYFYYVAHFQSIAGAAQHLKIDPASISRAIQTLEVRLGKALVLRKRSQWQLTEPGQQVFECVEAILGTLEHLGQRLEGSAVLKVKPLILRLPEWILCDYLIGTVNAFRQAQMPITLILDTEKTLVKADLERAMIIQLGRSANTAWVQKPLCFFRAGIYASQGYLERQGIPLNYSDLSRHRLVGLHTSDSILFEYMNWHKNRSLLTSKRLEAFYCVQDQAHLIKMAQAHEGIIAYIHNHPDLQKSGLLEILSEESERYAPQDFLYFGCKPSIWQQSEVQVLYKALKKSMRVQKKAK